MSPRLRRAAARLPGSTVLLLAVAALGIPAPATATGANPWASYFPAEGVTCTLATALPDGTTETENVTVVTKTARCIVSRSSLMGRETARPLPGRRLETRLSASEHVRRTSFRISLDATYPSPAALRAKRRGGRATATFTMTLSRHLADDVLQNGRTLTVSATYRIVGTGARRATLGDEAGTTVEAIGARTTLRTVQVLNATPDYARVLRRAVRPLIASLGGTEWLAEGRGTVLAQTPWPGGGTVTTTQTGCR